MTKSQETHQDSFFGTSFAILKQTGQEWLEDKAPQLGAALAYYTVFSLAPLVLVLLAIIGFIFRDDPAGAWSKVTEQMGYFLDQSAVNTVQEIAHKAAQPFACHEENSFALPSRSWLRFGEWRCSGGDSAPT